MKKIPVAIWSCVLLSVALSACSSNPNRTHRGDLLDDKVTQARVRTVVQRAGPELRRVHVQVVNGIVVLTGTVASEKIREQTEKVVQGVERVSGVDDRLRVVR